MVARVSTVAFQGIEGAPVDVQVMIGPGKVNMHIVGLGDKAVAESREREICNRIGPALRERGFIFVGIDVIGDYMTEINVTSPTGIREVKRFSGVDVASLMWDAIERKRV